MKDKYPKVDYDSFIYHANYGEFSLDTELRFEKHLRDLHNHVVRQKKNSIELQAVGLWYWRR